MISVWLLLGPDYIFAREEIDLCKCLFEIPSI